MSAIDTPDYQRGVVNAQVLLAKVTTGAGSVTVTVPPNTETLVICGEQGSTLNGVGVTGNQSGVVYQVVFARTSEGVSEASTIFADVSSALDSTVKVTVGSVTEGNWYVYADAGVHLVIDTGTLVNTDGVRYVAPVVPSTAAGEHPPDEVSQVTAGFQASKELLAAPGTGVRYRLFSMVLSSNSAGLLLTAEAGEGGEPLLQMGINEYASITYPPQGLPLPSDAGLWVAYDGTTQFGLATVVYTTEAV